MQLRIFGEANNGLEKLLQQASEKLQSHPNLRRSLPDGGSEISCRLPSEYKPSMNPWATELRARLSREWVLYSISEHSQGVSGGWTGTCIPDLLYRTFLTAWLRDASPKSSVMQLELF